MVDHRVEHGFEGGGVAPDLGEDEASLMGGEEGEGEPVGVDLGGKLAALMHRPDSLAERVLPVSEAAGDVLPGRWIGLGQLARQGADRATTPTLELALDRNRLVAPRAQGLDAVELAEQRFLGIEDGMALVVDYRMNERLLVGEVVVELRARHTGGALHVLDAGARHSSLEDQVRRRVDDPLSRLFALSGQAGRSYLRFRSHGTTITVVLELVIQKALWFGSSDPELCELERKSTMELEGKTALITGGTSGIGREVAKQLAERGAEVIVTGRDSERGSETVGEIEAAGGSARFLAADLADFEAIGRLAEEVGAVDVLVNNAVAFTFAPTPEETREGYEAMFDVNVRAPYFLTAALAPKMGERGGGSVINVTTMVAELGMPGSSAYGATKAALASLTRTWAGEFAPLGVRVNAVTAGPTRTEGTDAMSEEERDFVVGLTSIGRIAEANEIAELIAFLASSRSSYMTGANVAADGGATAVMG